MLKEYSSKILGIVYRILVIVSITAFVIFAVVEAKKQVISMLKVKEGSCYRKVDKQENEFEKTSYKYFVVKQVGENHYKVDIIWEDIRSRISMVYSVWDFFVFAGSEIDCALIPEGIK